MTSDSLPHLRIARQRNELVRVMVRQFRVPRQFAFARSIRPLRDDKGEIVVRFARRERLSLIGGAFTYSVSRFGARDASMLIG